MRDLSLVAGLAPRRGRRSARWCCRRCRAGSSCLYWSRGHRQWGLFRRLWSHLVRHQPKLFSNLFSVRLEHRSAGCWSSPGSVSEPVSRPPWGAAACRLARSRRGLAELGRLDHRTRARSSIGPLVVGRARGASASRCRDRPGAACRLGRSRRGLAELGRLDHRTEPARASVRWLSVEPGERQRAGVETALGLLVGLRGLDAASQSSAGSTTDTEQARHRSFVRRSSPGSVSEPASRPPWGAVAFRLARSRRGLAELGRLDHRQEPARFCSLVEPGERQRAGVETTLGCGCFSACAVSTRPRRARPARPPTRARSSIGPLFVGRARGASASRCRDRPEMRLLLGLGGLDAASQSSAGSTTNKSPLEHRSAGSLVEPGERQRAGVETTLRCGCFSACAVSTRPRRARPARPPNRRQARPPTRSGSAVERGFR